MLAFGLNNVMPQVMEKDLQTSKPGAVKTDELFTLPKQWQVRWRCLGYVGGWDRWVWAVIVCSHRMGGWDRLIYRASPMDG